jgi:uncharacterized membrane protein
MTPQGTEPACGFPSSVTGRTCVLPLGHPADSATRFHRFESGAADGLREVKRRVAVSVALAAVAYLITAATIVYIVWAQSFSQATDWKVATTTILIISAGVALFTAGAAFTWPGWNP